LARAVTPSSVTAVPLRSISSSESPHAAASPLATASVTSRTSRNERRSIDISDCRGGSSSSGPPRLLHLRRR
jgi:hypothetical protein